MIVTLVGVLLALLLGVFTFSTPPPEEIYVDDTEVEDVEELDPVEDVDSAALDYEGTISYTEFLNEQGVFEFRSDDVIIIPIDGLNDTQVGILENLVEEYNAGGMLTADDLRGFGAFVINTSHQLYTSDMEITIDDVPEEAINSDGSINIGEYFVSFEMIMNQLNEDQINRYLTLEYELLTDAITIDSYYESYGVLVGEVLGTIQ